MILTAAGLLLMLQAVAAPSPPRNPSRADIMIRQQIMVRVPRGTRRQVPGAESLEGWRERRGPRCIEARDIRGASLVGPSSVDLLMADRSRVRARLERRCPALDYYYGFYLDRNADGRICADRDVIRSRVGGTCEIDSFRALTREERR